MRIKDQPAEWRKFAWVLGAVLTLLGGLVAWRSPDRLAASLVLAGIGCAAALLGTLFPRCFRTIHRTSMTVSHHVGQLVGRIVLASLFVGLLTPLGLVARLCGKDFLRSRQPVRGYWLSTGKPGPLDRLF